MKKIIEEIKKKKEFSELPDSLVERVAKKTKGNVKSSRAFLRKYFGVFLTNKILKGKLNEEEILERHISTKNRDYKKLYKKIFDSEKVSTVIDLGCGVNGFSYKYLREVLGDVRYVGVEAVGQLVRQMNNYFNREKFNAIAKQRDLFDVKEVRKILARQKKPRVVFLFQVIDALESIEKNFSKKFLLEIKNYSEKIVLSYSLKSLSGKKVFKVQRKWLVNFIKENFILRKEFEIDGEKFLIFGKK